MHCVVTCPVCCSVGLRVPLRTSCKLGSCRMILRGEVSVAHASSALYFSCIDVKFVTETQDQPFFFFWSFRVDPGLTHGHLPSARECTRLAVSFCHHVFSSNFKLNSTDIWTSNAMPRGSHPQPRKEDRKASEAGWI